MKPSTQLRRIAAIVAVAALLALGGRELYYARSITYSPLLAHLSDAQLSKEASLVVTGTVERELGAVRLTDIAGELMVYTRWQIRPDRALKGQLPASLIVRTEGGRVGLTQVIAEDSVTLTKGEQVLLYLQPDTASSDLRVVGSLQGHFTLAQDPAGTLRATRQSTNEARSLTDLEALLP